MATPALNKTYIISSVRHPNYSIDHWNKETNNGTNVILWSTDVNDTAMHWTYKNNRLYPVASNTHCLDRYISSLSDSNNADLWEDNDDNTQALEFINTGDDRFLIRLRNNNTLYLTAADTPSGANQDSNSKNSNGNVYWDTLPGGVETTKNLWTFREVGGPTDEHGEVFPAAKTYVVTNVKHSGYSLDHWNAETNNGTNLILYPTNHGDQAQRWNYGGSGNFCLYPEKSGTHCIDRYIGNGSDSAGNSYNNADLWTAGSTSSDLNEQRLAFISDGNGRYFISLRAHREYYLTAAADPTNATWDGTTSSSSGNVYWAYALSGSDRDRQRWTLNEPQITPPDPGLGEEVTLDQYVYLITNVRHPQYSLDHWNAETNNGTNVILYPTNPADLAQQWNYGGTHNSRFSPVKSLRLCLDRYIGDGSNSPGNTYGNADLWTIGTGSIDEDQQLLTFWSSDHEQFYISLQAHRDLYLTAAEDPSNAHWEGTTSSSSGNVYWAPLYSSDRERQLWTLTAIAPPITDGEGTYAGLNWQYPFEDPTISEGDWGYDPHPEHPYGEAQGHWGIDIFCPEGTPLYSPASATVYAVGGSVFQRPESPSIDIDFASAHNSMGYFVVLKMKRPDPITGKTMYVRMLHMREVPLVRYGQDISAHTLLGYSGNTGRSDAPHLHFDVNIKSSAQYYGDNFTAATTINPVNFFPQISFPEFFYRYGVLS